LQETAAELERLTGGIVIWRSGAKLLIYQDPEGQKTWKPPQDNVLARAGKEYDSDSDSDDDDSN
jgi:hypothetical protein